MRKGFAYLAALFLLVILLGAAGYFALSARHWRGLAQADSCGLQAQVMAENAVEYYRREQPPLVKNQVSKIDRDILLLLEGRDYALAEQGFRIVMNKNSIYFIGYAGQLPEPVALKILYTGEGGQPQPWYE
ncbi:MAG: hypothetical protein LBQ83_02905 [Candidatus Margulisbacteria bacterium]|nr:hypothetical protein [Candidatus Margulisiibacteriota bacterium]